MKLLSFPRSRSSSRTSSPASSPTVGPLICNRSHPHLDVRSSVSHNVNALRWLLDEPDKVTQELSSRITEASFPKSTLRSKGSRGPRAMRPSLLPAMSNAASSSFSASSPLFQAQKARLGHACSSVLVEMKHLFAHFDANGDGKISAEELCKVLTSLGDNISEPEVLLMMAEADSNGDGFISFQEFLDVNMEGHCSADDDNLRATFNVFDLDKNGYITAHELHSVLTKLGDAQATLEDCRRMITGVDRKGIGQVDFDDFKLMMF